MNKLVGEIQRIIRESPDFIEVKERRTETFSGKITEINQKTLQVDIVFNDKKNDGVLTEIKNVDYSRMGGIKSAFSVGDIVTFSFPNGNKVTPVILSIIPERGSREVIAGSSTLSVFKG